MNQSLSTVLFDLDGTLIDTAPDFIWCLNTQRARYDLPPLAEPHIRAVVSNGAKALVRLGFDLSESDDLFVDRHTELLDLYINHLAVDTALFPGMDEVLKYLESEQIPWGIVTNKPRRFTEPLLEGLNLHNRCAVTVCPDDVRQRKPDPESLLLATDTLGVDPQAGIYVGDHERDIVAGRAAGMTTVASRYGYVGDPAEVDRWQADCIIDHGRELLPIVSR